MVQNYMLLYGAVIVLIIAFLVLRKPGKNRMKLRLSGAKKKVSRGRSPLSVNIEELERQIDEEKSLNVIFNYNAYSWDAYEVLGIPAGSSFAAVEQAYQKALDDVEPESQNLIHAAYQAIRMKNSG